MLSQGVSSIILDQQGSCCRDERGFGLWSKHLWMSVFLYQKFRCLVLRQGYRIRGIIMGWPNGGWEGPVISLVNAGNQWYPYDNLLLAARPREKSGEVR